MKIKFSAKRSANLGESNDSLLPVYPATLYVRNGCSRIASDLLLGFRFPSFTQAQLMFFPLNNTQDLSDRTFVAFWEMQPRRRDEFTVTCVSFLLLLICDVLSVYFCVWSNGIWTPQDNIELPGVLAPLKERMLPANRMNTLVKGKESLDWGEAKFDIFKIN